ncbi:MAG: polysaccharide deacetylase family protein [Oscillospiraceae bacterium]
MEWKGFFLFLLLLLFLTVPEAALPPLPASGDAAVETESKFVALTFDDGPRRDTTARLLDGLRERGAAATFFLVGERIAPNRDLVLRMGREGHQVGNHTYTHCKLQGCTGETVATELRRTDDMLQALLGTDTYWVRPPYGLIDPQNQALIPAPLVHWSVDPEDWKLLDTQKVTGAVLDAVEPGDIILMHDFYGTSVDAALAIVDTLQAEGYVFVTVEELLSLYQIDPEPGVLYRSAKPGAWDAAF